MLSLKNVYTVLLEDHYYTCSKRSRKNDLSRKLCFKRRPTEAWALIQIGYYYILIPILNTSLVKRLSKNNLDL